MLQFLPFVSRLEAGFWHELGRRKLECFKLSEAQQELHGSYSNSMSVYIICMCPAHVWEREWLVGTTYVCCVYGLI